MSEFLANQDQKNSDANQRRNQSTDDQRNNPIPATIDRLRPSAFLRRSDAQPEEKFVHRSSSVLLWRGLAVLTSAMNVPTWRAPSPQIRTRDTSLDGAANGSTRVNTATNVDARVNSATHLGGQRCGDHEDSTNY